MQRRSALFTFLITFLFACDATSPNEGLQSVGAPATNTPDSGQSISTVATTTVSGRSAKGPLINATIQLFEIDGAGYSLQTTPVAQTQSDDKGFWQISLPERDANLLVRTSGGRYVDEADESLDSRREIVLGSDDALLSILPPDADSVSVTILSHALIEKSRRESSAGNFAQVLASNRSAFARAAGVDVLTVLPADPLAPQGSLGENRYALQIGGIANAVNALSIAMNAPVPDYSHIEMVMQDLVDCQFDGRGIAGRAVWPSDLISVPTLSLNQEIVRFYNNNAAAYSTINLDQIDFALCAATGGSMDTVAPVLQLGSVVQLAASDALGIVTSDAVRAQISAQWIATDDRVGSLGVQAQWPERFVLGDNVLSVTAVDAWENRTTETLTVSVSDQSPPIFTTLSVLTFAATGDLTLVDLPRPDVIDNVSENDALTVTNDAPASGFTPGFTTITWQAADEAGLVASALQTVEITSLAPTLANVPNQILFNGTPIDLSVFFADPDQTTLAYFLNGLPGGSGLVFNTVTGLLSGVPSSFDAEASPLVLTVQATDGPNTIEFTFDLLVPPLNTAPEFSLSVGQLALDEDFTPQSVPISLVPPPITEQDQNVSYSVELIADGATPPVSVALTGQVLTITAVANASGTAIARVTANDGQVANPEFSVDLPIVVNPVNDPPQSLGVVVSSDLITGLEFSLDLANAVVDVDDEALQFAAQRLPDSFMLDSTGLLSAVPQPVDAFANPLEIIVQVQDQAGASTVQIVQLTVSDPDSDGDGVSDYDERLAGLDPLSSDTDNDGFSDQLEFVLPLDLNTQTIFYVAPNGNDVADGLSVATALATLTEASVRINQIAANVASVVLVAASEDPYVGTLQIVGGTAGRSVVGSVDFINGGFVDDFAAVPATHLRNDDALAVDIQSCGQCAFYFIAIEQGRGMQVADSQMHALGVHWQSLGATGNGAGLSLDASIVTLEQAVFANNFSAAAGGAVALEQGSELTVYDSQFSGNGAAGQGGAIFASSSVVKLNNVLLAANTAPDGVLVAASNSTVSIESATASFNHVTSFNQGELLSCQRSADGVTTNCALNERAIVKNSVVILNRDASGRVLDFDRNAVTGNYNLLEPARAVDVGEVEAIAPVTFAANFGLTSTLGSSLAVAIDAGDAAAQIALVAQYFALANDPFADSAQLDLGYHQRRPLIALAPDKPKALLADVQGLQYGPTAIDLTLGYSDEQLLPLGPGQQVMVRAESRDPRVQVISPAPLLETDGFRLATDLGNGRYRVWLNSAWRTSRDRLEIVVNNHANVLIVQPTCSLNLCSNRLNASQVNNHQGADKAVWRR